MHADAEYQRRLNRHITAMMNIAANHHHKPTATGTIAKT